MNLDDLKDLQNKMWEEVHGDRRGLTYHREIGTLTKNQIDNIFSLIKQEKLLCKLRCVGFGFGKIGLDIYQDELYPGTGATPLFCFSQNHLDPKDYPWTSRATLGDPHKEAFDLFSIALEEDTLQRWKRLGITPKTKMQDFSY